MMVILVSGMTLEGYDHLEKYVHDVDYFKIIFFPIILELTFIGLLYYF
jgi:hypothetical protein